MSLVEWLKNGWLIEHRTSRQEIEHRLWGELEEAIEKGWAIESGRKKRDILIRLSNYTQHLE